MTSSTSNPALYAWQCYCWLLGLGITILLAFGGHWFLLRPLTQSRQESERNIEQLNRFARCGAVIETRHASISKTHAAKKEAAESQQIRLPAAAHEAEFLEWTSQQANNLGWELRDFRPAGSTKFGEYEGMTIRIHATGTYASLCEYLQALSTGPRASRLVSLEITPQDATHEQFQFTLQVIVFYQTPKTPPTNTGEKTHA